MHIAQNTKHIHVVHSILMHAKMFNRLSNQNVYAIYECTVGGLITVGKLLT